MRVERGDALRAVHAVDHVVEVLRAEDHLERRGLIRRVERDEALRDRALALVQVALRDLQLVAILAQVALDLRKLCGRSVVLRARALERVGELLQLPHDLLRLCSLRRDRRVRKCWDCRQEGTTDPCENVRRLSQPTNDEPRFGGGTGAPGGAGTSRGGRLAMCSDQRQCGTTANLRETCSFLHEVRQSCSWTVVRSPFVLGQAHNAAAAHVLVRRDRRWRCSIAPSVVGANPSHGAPRRCGPRCCDRREVARGRARPLFARPAAGRRTVEARGPSRPGAGASRRAAEPPPSARDRQTKHAHLAGALAQRLRLLYEEGNVEPLEIVFGSKSLDEALTNSTT